MSGEDAEQLAPITQVSIDDLLKFGLIPEFVGRLPVSVSLSPLTHGDLIRILTEPKNAIIKQYQRFFSIDKVELLFTQDALESAADLALKQRTGARGLRTIIEEVLLDVMYEVPSRSDIKRITVNGDTISRRAEPVVESRAEVTPLHTEKSA